MSNPQLIEVEAAGITANEMLLAKNAAEILHKHYPGHLWAVNVAESRLEVRNLYLSGEWGFILRIPDFYSASDWDKQILRAGGEILERYRQARGRVDEASIHQLPTDFAGRHKPEL